MSRIGLISLLKNYNVHLHANQKLIQKRFVTRRVIQSDNCYVILFELGILTMQYTNVITIIYEFPYHEFKMYASNTIRMIYSHYPYDAPQRGDDDFDEIIDTVGDYRELFVTHYNAPNYPNAWDGIRDYPRVYNEAENKVYLT